MAVTLGASDKKYISAISMLDQREILSSVLDVWNDAELSDIMNIVNRYKPVKQPVYYNYVRDSLYLLLDSTGATVTGSGTATVGTTTTVATSGYARKTDLIKFPNGKVGYVTNVVTASSQDTLTIKSVDGTNLTHTAGQKLSPFSNAFGEKSQKPVNRKYGFTQYSNVIQIFRELNQETDIQSMSTVEVSYKGQNYIIYKELAEKFLKHKADINGSLIGGYISSTRFSDASPAYVDPIAGGAVQTTRGLDQYITTYGVNDAVAVAGTWNFADLDDTIAQLLVNKSTKNFIVIRGTKAAGKMDTYLKGLGSSGVTSARLEVNGSSFNYMVDNFTYSGFKFQMSPAPILDHQEMFSQTDIPKSIYFLPTDSVRGSDGQQPRIQIRYMPHNILNNRGNEYFAEFHTGAVGASELSGTATTDELVSETHWVSYQGLECLGLSSFAKCVVL